MRIKPIHDGYQVDECYPHKEANVMLKPSHSLSSTIKNFIVERAAVGCTAMSVMTDMYQSSAIPNHLIPGTKQVQNFLYYYGIKQFSKMDLSVDISNLAKNHAEGDGTPSGMIITGTHHFKAKNKRDEPINGLGFTFTTPDMIQNLSHAWDISRTNGLVLASDGTFRLITGGWVLLIVGSNVVLYDNLGESRLSLYLQTKLRTKREMSIT
jgi:hypothetical protein